MSQATIFLFGVAVFFLGGVGIVLIGLDAFRSWSAEDEAAGESALREAEQERADARFETAPDGARDGDR